MSKIGVVSDIHANKPAFEAVLEELQTSNIDYIVCVGDIVGICGFPSECISLVQDNCKYVIKGNHDVAMFEGDLDSDVIEVEQQLFFDESTDEEQSWLYKLPTMIDVSETSLLLAHSYPFEGKSSGYEDGNAGVYPRDYIEVGSQFSDKIVCLGHTHEQHSVNLNTYGHNVLVVNPGSVGGFYQDKAEFSIIDTESLSVVEKTVAYDKTVVANRVTQLEEKYDMSLLD